MNKLEEFISEWFIHPEWWFSKKDDYDNYIKNQYSNLLDNNINSEPLNLIILYDQLPRHIFRNESASHIIEYYLQKALNIIEQHIYTDYYYTLINEKLIFFLLPLRHTKDISKILLAIKEIWNRKDKNNIYKRFLKAAYTNINTEDQSYFLDKNTLINHNFIDILDNKPLLNLWQSSDKNICKLNIESDTILLSLSGGVDSMVCSSVLSNYCKNNRKKLYAIHINYTNREECNKEVEFLKYWCKCIDVPLFIRNINEINRKPCMDYDLRDLYESYTRNIRYGYYKTIWKLLNKNNSPIVILGHNKDDCFENIMTNIAQKQKYSNLEGMSYSIIQDNINFIRPLIDVSKDTIIKFAKNNNIPYLPNSTPLWSQRGKIRNSILPVINSWNVEYVNGLFELSSQMSDMYEMMNSMIDIFITNAIEYNDNVFITKYDKLSKSTLFWRLLINKLYGIYPSSKSLQNLIEAIKTLKGPSTMLTFSQASKNLGQPRKVMITKDIIIIFINDELNIKKIDK